MHLSYIRKAAAYSFNAMPNNYVKAGLCTWTDTYSKVCKPGKLSVLAESYYFVFVHRTNC